MGKISVPPLLPRGSFCGIPTHFRGWCHTASQGGSTGGYRWVGLKFGEGLLGYDPHDLERDEWLTVVAQMIERCFPDCEPANREAIAAWLPRHFPRMMKLVATSRFERFVDGFVEAYESGEMLADFPRDFEPVDVDLDDPCQGVGYVRTYQQYPVHREVVYQCPAEGCREASLAAVENYAAEYGLATVQQDGILATIRDL